MQAGCGQWRATDRGAGAWPGGGGEGAWGSALRLPTTPPTGEVTPCFGALSRAIGAGYALVSRRAPFEGRLRFARPFLGVSGMSGVSDGIHNDIPPLPATAWPTTMVAGGTLGRPGRRVGAAVFMACISCGCIPVLPLVVDLQCRYARTLSIVRGRPLLQLVVQGVRSRSPGGPVARSRLTPLITCIPLARRPRRSPGFLGDRSQEAAYTLALCRLLGLRPGLANRAHTDTPG